jgi:putative tryptophan/tyrosine transport system substrate-binding protein
MRRREFLATALGAASMSPPLGVFGQTASRVAKVGHLESGFPSTAPNLLAAFRQGLRDLGYIDGQNLFIVSRYGEGREERLRRSPMSWSNMGSMSSLPSVRRKQSPSQR